ncbi:MAG: RluA family pseudouridine synthase, partial [Patescibacteria group bacterium]
MLNTIFEDEYLLVLAKPPGQTVNISQTTKRQKTLQDELEDYFGIKNSAEGIGGRAGIVHRLDKETSGILVVAKSQGAFENLQAQFKERKTEKEYRALVHGKTSPEGKIEAPLGRIGAFGGKFGVIAGGREAQTSFKTEKYYQREGEVFSFLAVHPLTGRTHQIRVHLKHIGYPVVSDPLYLSSNRLKEDLKFCPRLFL